ncbi:MAG: DUF2306 domain-containing protein [Betaproteobacteria bacterium]|nr:DUF2306 domain-containing protein [Betaproteobacteria bacterium]
MNAILSAARWDFDDPAAKSLKAAATFWFVAAVAGQWMFAYYMVALYGGSAVQGNWAPWEKHGFNAADAAGSAAIVVHLLFAVVLTVGGPLQLIPQVRIHAPRLHRWNGRVFLTAAAISAIAGLFMVWMRGTVGSFLSHLAISLDAVLILLCGAMALRHALARQFAVHRRWALRLFLVVNGVWFFRVGLMFWLIVNRGPAGFDPKTFQGPFIDILSFAESLLPLAVLELYLRARDGGSAAGRWAVTGLLLVATVAMGVGIFGATMGMWLPKIR